MRFLDHFKFFKILLSSYSLERKKMKLKTILNEANNTEFYCSSDYICNLQDNICMHKEKLRNDANKLIKKYE